MEGERGNGVGAAGGGGRLRFFSPTLDGRHAYARARPDVLEAIGRRSCRVVIASDGVCLAFTAFFLHTVPNRLNGGPVPTGA